MVSWTRPAFLSLTLFLSTLTQASITDYTIDDSSPDPRTGNSIIYSPPNAWNTATLCKGGSDLSKCFAQPNKSRVYRETWHESTFSPDPHTPLVATVKFDGTAVYVFCVLDGVLSGLTTDMSFTIDGRLVGVFTQRASPLIDYQYDILAFSTTSLSPGLHELEIASGRPGGDAALIILDRIVYSFDDGITIPPLPDQFQNNVSISSTITERPTPTTTHTPLDTVSSTQSNTTTTNMLTATPPPSNLERPAGGNSSVTSSTIPKTSDSQVAPTHSTLQPGLIIGIVLGSVAALLISVVIFLLFWRRRRRARSTVSAGVPVNANGSSTSDVDPFLSDAHHSMSNGDQPRWFIASDSKRTLLETAPPPMYS